MSTYEEPAETGSSKCHLLDLPWELRDTIIRYTLPRTKPYKPEPAWTGGSVAILRANKQLHEEGRRVLYGCNTFHLDVLYDCSSVTMLWLRPSRDPNHVLHIRRIKPFPEHLSKRDIQLIRRLDITINHVDSYTGEVKYGYGGRGLTEGLKTQVTFLCQTLRQLPVIEKLELCFSCQDARQVEETQIVLDPFLVLKNVKEITTSGHILESTANKLKEKLPEAQRTAAVDSETEGSEDGDGASLVRPPNLESNVKKGLALYRGYDGRDI